MEIDDDVTTYDDDDDDHMLGVVLIFRMGVLAEW